MENWVGSEVAEMKTTFFDIFDPTWTHLLAPKSPSSNNQFLKQQFNFLAILALNFHSENCKTTILLALKCISHVKNEKKNY